MKPGWNPSRRNRNIGTSKQGHGKNNRLVIPERWSDSRIFWERLHNPIAVTRNIGTHSITFLIEPTHAGFVHACTVDDITHLLEKIPSAHLQEIDLIVLRQPKRKENLLSPVWGRLAYWADMGRYSGSAVYLEAQCLSKVWRWNRSLTPSNTKELERLRQDGHTITEEKHHYLISSTLESIRVTQLYRTLPHEIGHNVDYITSVIEPSVKTSDEAETEWLRQRYKSKTLEDKEAFAHRYAEEFHTKLLLEGYIPFLRLIDETKMAAEGLNLSWFKGTEFSLNSCNLPLTT
ncbi:MAG TPA: hypothetical protein V6D26_01065 [Stenomitos sp.]